MNRDTPHPRFRSPVVAALETVAAMRLNDGREGGTDVRPELNTIDRTIALVEAASERIKANDFSAVETLFAGQALALDAMFDKHARATTLDDIRFALRSQGAMPRDVQDVDPDETSARRKFSRKRTEQSSESSV